MIIELPKRIKYALNPKINLYKPDVIITGFKFSKKKILKDVALTVNELTYDALFRAAEVGAEIGYKALVNALLDTGIDFEIIVVPWNKLLVAHMDVNFVIPIRREKINVIWR